MKKIVSKFLVCAMIITNSVAVFGATTHIFLDGKKLILDKSPFVENNRTYLPLRAVSENLGALVDWNGQTKIITISKKDVTVILRVGNNVAKVNNIEVKLDVAPKIKDNTTYVPVRFVADYLGVSVDYYKESDIVSLITDTDNAIAIKNSVSQIREVVNKIEDLPLESINKYGDAFKGKGNIDLTQPGLPTIPEITIVNKSEFPLRIGNLTIYDMYINSSNTLIVKQKVDDKFNKPVIVRLSDELGLVRTRGASKNSVDSKGIVTAEYLQTELSDWSIDGDNFEKYTFNSVNYFVILNDSKLMAIPILEVR